MDAGMRQPNRWRRTLKRSPLIAGAVEQARRAMGLPNRLRGRRRRGRQIREYLRGCSRPMLNLGCGPNLLEGWLNTDISGRSGAVYLDATRAFPLPDACMERTYSEHLIEHLGYANARQCLAECFRVLRPGGRIRIATPDLARLARLLDPDRRTSADEAYLRWFWQWQFADLGPPEPAGVVNHFLRAWGHRFVFDRPSLERLLSESGFDQLRQYPPGQSDDEAFVDIEHHGQTLSDPCQADWETMVIEARRPANSG